ncbi:MAG: hypothetical protein AAF368_13945, partial [Planctomycetota bacterium]
MTPETQELDLGEAQRDPTDLSRDEPSSRASSLSTETTGEIVPEERRVAAAIKTARIRFQVYTQINDEGDYVGDEALVTWTLFNDEEEQIATGEAQADEQGHGAFLIHLSHEVEGLYLRLQGKKQGITNGTLGTVMSVKNNQLKIKLDDNRIVSLNPQSYPYLSHGYALSMNKSQGKTFDKSYVMVNSPMEAAHTYVAL